MYEETWRLRKVHGKLFTLLCLRTSSTPLGNSFELWYNGGGNRRNEANILGLSFIDGHSIVSQLIFTLLILFILVLFGKKNSNLPKIKTSNKSGFFDMHLLAYDSGMPGHKLEKKLDYCFFPWFVGLIWLLMLCFPRWVIIIIWL